jgi:hypothetical protein
MRRSVPAKPHFPDHLAQIRAVETALQEQSEVSLYAGELGIRGSGLYGALARGLELWSGATGCRWRCPGGTHDFQKLHRRALNAEYAALRLAFAGYYDEAIAVVRIGAEILNLAQLFTATPDQHDVWMTASERARRRDFAPAAVRRSLEKLSVPPFYDSETYGALCEGGVHLSPSTRERTHDLDGNRFIVGPSGSISGFLLILNEVAYAVDCALSLSTVSAELPGAERIEAAAIKTALTAAIGAGELRMRSYSNSLGWFLAQLDEHASSTGESDVSQ